MAGSRGSRAAKRVADAASGGAGWIVAFPSGPAWFIRMAPGLVSQINAVRQQLEEREREEHLRLRRVMRPRRR
jgi:hypothetical protein